MKVGNRELYAPSDFEDFTVNFEREYKEFMDMRDPYAESSEHEMEME